MTENEKKMQAMKLALETLTPEDLEEAINLKAHRRSVKEHADHDVEKCRTVTDFITWNTVNNGDSFYTPFEEVFETHEEAVKAYKWNQNREDSEHVDDEDPTSEAPHPRMFGFLELPYGHICTCGGSMLALIQLDENKQPLKTLLIDCG